MNRQLKELIQSDIARYYPGALFMWRFLNLSLVHSIVYRKAHFYATHNKLLGVLYANNETKECLKKVAGKNASAPVMTEIGVNESDLRAKIQNDPRQDITFLCAGRLIYRKGIDLLFDALELLPDHSNYTIKIVGGVKNMNNYLHVVNDH